LSYSHAYESTVTGRIKSISIVFYEDNGIIHAVATFKDKKDRYVSITNAYATVVMTYYCREISPLINRPDTNAYREEKDITVRSRYFEEITLDDGNTIFGLPIFRYDGTPWFTYDMNYYKMDDEIFYDRQRFCKKVSLYFNCRGLEAESVLKLNLSEEKLKTRIHITPEGGK
jgi:hypothetical protein